MLFGLNKRLLVTLASGLLVVFSSAASAQDAKDVKLHTVVIDAGHGGHDAGALSPDRKVRECDINLEIALALGQMIKDSDGKDTVVIYIANPQAKKELPRNMTVNGSGPLFDELKARFGEGNVVLQ